MSRAIEGAEPEFWVFIFEVSWHSRRAFTQFENLSNDLAALPFPTPELQHNVNDINSLSTLHTCSEEKWNKKQLNDKVPAPYALYYSLHGTYKLLLRKHALVFIRKLLLLAHLVSSSVTIFTKAKYSVCNQLLTSNQPSHPLASKYTLSTTEATG